MKKLKTKTRRFDNKRKKIFVAIPRILNDSLYERDELKKRIDS